MREFKKLQNNGSKLIKEIEKQIKDQAIFSKKSEAEKISLFKDYLFLQTVQNHMYDNDVAEGIYYEISLGSNGLNSLLNTVVAKIDTGADCLDILNNNTLKDTITESITGEEIEDITAKRNSIADVVSNGDYKKLKNRQEKIKVDMMAAKLSEINGQVEILEDDLAIDDVKIAKEMKDFSAHKSMEEILKANNEAYDFIRDLDEAIDNVEKDADNLIKDDDEVEELFSGNIAAKERKNKRKQNKENFMSAVDKAEGKGDKKSDDLNQMMDDLEKGVEIDGNLGLNDNNELNDALNFNRELELNMNQGKAQADIIRDKEKEEDLLEEIFPENENVKKKIDNKNKKLQEDAKKKEADAKLWEDRQKAYEKEVADINEKAFKAQDEAEHELRNQAAYEQMNDEKKIALARKYMLNTGAMQPEIDAYKLEDISSLINGPEFYLAVKETLNYVHSGSGLIKALNTTYMKQLAFDNILENNGNFFKGENAKKSYISELKYIESQEIKNHGKHGLFIYDEDELKDKNEEADELADLFGENENVKNQQKEDAEARIQKKKDAIKERVRKQNEEAERIKNATKGMADKALDFVDKEKVKFFAFDTKEQKNLRLRMTEEQAKEELKRVEKAFNNNVVFQKLEYKDKEKLVKDYLYAKGIANGTDYDLQLLEVSEEEKREKLYSAVYSNGGIEKASRELFGDLKNSKNCFRVIKNTQLLDHHVTKEIYIDQAHNFDIEVDKRRFKDAVASTKAEETKIENVRKNPGKYDATYDNYIILHTGDAAGKTKEELVNNIAKIYAAEKLKKAGKKFSVKKIHSMAKSIRKEFSLDVLSKVKNENILRSWLADGKSAASCIFGIKDRLFDVAPKQRDSFKKDLKRILNSMDEPTGRSDKYIRFYNSVKAVAENRIFSTSDVEELYAATFDYIDKKETKRTLDKGIRAFNNSMDVLSTLMKYAPGTSLYTMKVVDKINVIRKGKDPIESDMEKFKAEYGPARAEKNKKPEPKKKAQAKSKSYNR